MLWLTTALNDLGDVAEEETDVLMYCGVEKNFNTIQKTHTHTHVTYLYCICVLNLLHVPGPFLVWSGTVVLVALVSATGAGAGPG